jgi:hypothetical protein
LAFDSVMAAVMVVLAVGVVGTTSAVMAAFMASTLGLATSSIGSMRVFA